MSSLEYYIVSRVEFIGGQVTYTHVGYVYNNQALCAEINSNYENTYEAWIASNLSELQAGTKDISEFFNTTPLVYTAKTQSDQDYGLVQINDITDL